MLQIVPHAPRDSDPGVSPDGEILRVQTSIVAPLAMQRLQKSTVERNTLHALRPATNSVALWESMQTKAIGCKRRVTRNANKDYTSIVVENAKGTRVTGCCPRQAPMYLGSKCVAGSITGSKRGSPFGCVELEWTSAAELKNKSLLSWSRPAFVVLGWASTTSASTAQPR